MTEIIENIRHIKYNLDYDRIVSGERLNIINRPYTTDFIKDLVLHFEEIEEYEKCSNLIKILKKIDNHNSNYII